MPDDRPCCTWHDEDQSGGIAASAIGDLGQGMATQLAKHSAKLRPAVHADLTVLGNFGALLLELHHELDAKRFIEPTTNTPARYAGFLKSQLSRTDTILLVAEDNGAVLGYVYAAHEGYDYMALRGPAGVVHDLFVDPARRRQGVGRLLLEAAIERLRAMGSDRFVLSTAYLNEAARNLFTTMGFRPTMVEMTREATADGK